MEAQTVRPTPSSLADRLPPGLRRFAHLEQILGAVLVLTPALLYFADTGRDGFRDSISAYHDVSAPTAFYVPLTAAAMLFLVNGLVRDAHSYNVVLGLALAGVILFDHDGGTSIPHVGFALVFFVGNAVVMLLFSTNKSTLLKVVVGAGIVAALVLWRTTSIFWAEWASLSIIAAHYVLDSLRWSRYRALEPGERPRLAPAK